jgi:hypothetical protein
VYLIPVESTEIGTVRYPPSHSVAATTAPPLFAIRRLTHNPDARCSNTVSAVDIVTVTLILMVSKYYCLQGCAAVCSGRSLRKCNYICIQQCFKSRYSDWLRAWRPRGRSSSPGRVKNFLFSTSSRPALVPTQPPSRWVAGGSLTGGKAARAWSWPLTSN